jgi:hypothetical protein
VGGKVLAPTLIEVDLPLTPGATRGLGSRYRRRASGGVLEEAMLNEYMAGVCDALGIDHERVVGFDDDKGLRVRATADEITRAI